MSVVGLVVLVACLVLATNFALAFRAAPPAAEGEAAGAAGSAPSEAPASLRAAVAPGPRAVRQVAEESAEEPDAADAADAGDAGDAAGDVVAAPAERAPAAVAPPRAADPATAARAALRAASWAAAGLTPPAPALAPALAPAPPVLLPHAAAPPPPVFAPAFRPPEPAYAPPAPVLAPAAAPALAPAVVAPGAPPARDAPGAPPAPGAPAPAAPPSARLSRPEWASAILAAAPPGGESGAIGASFTRFDVAGASFFYAIEDTLHSAQYIAQHEGGNVAYWTAALAAASSAQPCYVLDVGSNGGYFSLLSRALGCSVLAVDAQPRCLQRLNSAAALNGFSDGLTTRWAAVTDGSPGAPAAIRTGATRCSGLWGADAGSAWINAESSSEVDVAGAPLMELVAGWLPERATVAALKIDVEGSEVAVLRSALPLLQARRVRAVLAEVVPARVRAITAWPVVRQTLEDVHEAGLRCGEMGHGTFSLAELLAIFDPASSRVVGMDWYCDLAA